MKVGNPSVKPSQIDITQQRDSVSNSSKGLTEDKGLSAGELESSSKVEMSDRAQAMNKAKALASADTVDEAKVAHLQRLIDEGRYSTDAAAIADRMVDEHLLMTD